MKGSFSGWGIAALMALAAPVALMATPPIQVLTVPWVPAAPATPHSSWSGHQVTLKGTSNVQDTGGNTILYDWDPGDSGSPSHCTGTVTNQFVIECSHIYSGAVGTTFNAVLTVYDSTTGTGGVGPYSNSASASYYTQLFADPNLPIETNAAIDAGLWYLHKTMNRYASVTVSSITVTNGGSGYESDGSTPPNVTFTGCAVSPTATAVVGGTGGPITAISLTSLGSGCVAPVTVAITDPLAAGGSITGVSITGPGLNYALEYSGGYYSDVLVRFASGTGGPLYGDPYPYGIASVDTIFGSPTFGQIQGVTVYDPGVGLSGPVTATFTDLYCMADPYFGGGNYKQPLQPSYLGDGTTQACGSGAVASVTVSPVNAGGAGATATANLSAPLNLGDWSVCNGKASACGIPVSGVTATNCTAFEVSGHLESGPATDPYTDTVARCLASTFNIMVTHNIGNPPSTPSTKTNTFGTFNPDQNNNGIAVGTSDSNDMYQTGMLMDAVVASGEKTKPVTVGSLASLTHPGGSGPYTYQDAIFDLVDYYAYCELDAGSGTNHTAPLGNIEGAWVYTCNSSYNDNSVSQWAAIGVIPARRNFGASFPAEDLLANQAWLQYSQGGDGSFGYTSSSQIWGPYADTPSGMVQLAMNGIGRGAPGPPTQFDNAETFIRDHFDIAQTGNALNALKDYYYGMFSFTKSMLLHDKSGTGLVSSPIQLLQSLDSSLVPIDWYAAQASSGDTSDGVARTLISGTPGNGISGQNSDGSWNGHYYSGEQSYFETAWAVIMLNHTVFQGVPVPCQTNGSPAADLSTIQLNGQCSSDTDPNHEVVEWQWDVSGNAGTNFTLNGVIVNYKFIAPVGATFPYNYPVRLRVSDNSTPPLTADLTFNVVLNAPTTISAPIANAGGPYNFCPNTNAQGVPAYTPWYLNGSLSSQSPPALITQYNWDYSCGGVFNSSHVEQPRVDTGANNFFNHNSTPFNVCLQVVNDSALSGTASASVTVHDPTDFQCAHCVSTLVGKPKNFTPGKPNSGNVQLYWTDTNTNATFPIDHYNVYRSFNADFSGAVEVAGVNGGSSAIKADSGGTLNFIDGSITKATIYYYRIAPATINDTETCGSNLTLMVTVGGRI